MKRVVSVLLCLSLCFFIICPVSAFAANRDTSFENSLAEKLKTLNMFKGVSDTDFDLDRAPTRFESIVMLIRLLGKENEAASSSWEHPFTDVPKWADNYIGYAYCNGLTSGVSATEFGTGDASLNMYLTFVLRALGFSDADSEDFSWSDPYTLAEEIGILPDYVDRTDFWRADAVSVSYAALSANMKDSDQTLAQKLIESDVFSEEAFNTVYVQNPPYSPIEEAPVVTETPVVTPVVTRNVVNPENYHGHVYTGGSSSKKYHYEAECAGKNSHEITWAEVDRRGLEPCGTCVLK